MFAGNWAATTAPNTLINDVKNKIPYITNLATTGSVTAVESKIPNVTNVVKKTDYNTNISELKIKFLLIMIMVNILLLKNLISRHQKILLKE